MPPDVNSITSGVWTPDDQYVYLGTSQGGLLVMDIQGNTVGRVSLREGMPITELSWNCERFNMEEQTDRNSQNNHSQHSYQNYTQFRKPEFGASLHTSNRNYSTDDSGNDPSLNVAAVPSYKPDGKNGVINVHYPNLLPKF